MSDDITRNYHGGNRYSRDAFDSLTTQQKENDKMRIRALMIEIGPKIGVICDEAERFLKMSHQTCSARFSDMRHKDKELVKVGERPTRSGRMAAAWTLLRLKPDEQ